MAMRSRRDVQLQSEMALVSGQDMHVEREVARHARFDATMDESRMAVLDAWSCCGCMRRFVPLRTGQLAASWNNALC